MARVEVDIHAAPAVGSLGLLEAYAQVVVEVGDLGAAERFYGEVLGFGRDGKTPDGPRFRVADGQFVVLKSSPSPRTLPDSGVHQAYRFTAPELAAVTQRLAAEGVVIEDYREDRHAEDDQNRYCADPAGNRVQLVLGESRGIDHAAVETHDLEWAEVFYTHVLGGAIETRIGWHMDDYARAQEWAEGREKCAPGLRRWEKLYAEGAENARVARVTPHLFVDLGVGALLGIYLATEHRQEPPPDEFRGTPRLGFRVARGRLAEVEERLRNYVLRCMESNPATGGPFEQAAGRLFVRDPGGNFLELGEG